MGEKPGDFGVKRMKLVTTTVVKKNRTIHVKRGDLPENFKRSRTLVLIIILIIIRRGIRIIIIIIIINININPTSCMPKFVKRSNILAGDRDDADEVLYEEGTE